jgi:hypothetical protein
LWCCTSALSRYGINLSFSLMCNAMQAETIKAFCKQKGILTFSNLEAYCRGNSIDALNSNGKTTPCLLSPCLRMAADRQDDFRSDQRTLFCYYVRFGVRHLGKWPPVVYWKPHMPTVSPSHSASKLQSSHPSYHA